LLRRVRESADGPLLLVKGPEVARHYPDPSLRDFRDVDLIVRDSAATQRQLLAAGFEEVGEPWVYEGIHHLRPLHWPGLPLVVEVHHSPKWLDHVEPPTAGSLLCAGVRRPDGLLVPPPAHHALVLAAHGWAHRPLTRVRDLLDVALVALAANPAEVDRLAGAWGVRRMWRTTARAIGAVLGAGRRPVSVAVWARHLEDARERTVLESHLQRSLSDLWGLPRNRLLAAGDGVRGILAPEDGEGWPDKLARTRAAIGNAFTPKSQHDRMLQRKEEDGPASTAEPPARVA
ncbi:MAG: nucleotidyltransferase family protein, partial [Thermoleophilaceae bacterium]